MSGFDPSEYVDVAERVKQFYAKYPDGRLTTHAFYPQEIDNKTFMVCHAKAYRTPDDPLPADGVAWEPVPGPTQFTKDSELMNAQTAAVGRAIVMLGFDTKKIASRQEVEARNGDPLGLQESRADNVQPGQMLVTFGKHRDKKVCEVPTDYWEWWLSQDGKKDEALKAAVELHLGPVSVGAGPDPLDIPF